MNEQILQTLTQTGLNDKEAKFYLGLLQTGPTTVWPAAKKAGLKRTSVYNFIDHLLELGLVTFFDKNNRRYYRAENPQQLDGIIKSRQTEIANILPALIKIYESQSQQPETKMFYGLNGLKQALLNTLNSQEKKIYDIIDVASAIDTLGIKFWEDYIEELTRRGIIGHSLRHEEEKIAAPNYKYLKREGYEKTLLVPRYLPKHIQIPNTLFVYDHTVVIASPAKENWTMVVESESFSATIKTLHDLLWQISR